MSHTFDTRSGSLGALDGTLLNNVSQKTVFRNDTTIHFVFKRNALVFLGYSYCKLGQMKVAPLVKTQKFREKAT